MKSAIILLVSTLVTYEISYAQDVLWQHQFDEAFLSAGTVDAAGNVYSIGYFRYFSPDFDPGAATVHLPHAGEDDIFIQKLDSDGNLIWVKSIGNIDHDQPRALGLDDSGNLYITGFFSGRVDLDPGNDTFFLQSTYATAQFILKLDTAGNFVWVKQFEAGEITSFVIDNGYLYLTGMFQDTVDFNPGPATHFLYAPNLYNSFILKLTLAGDFVWVRQVGGEFVLGRAITVHENVVYATGYFSHGLAHFYTATDTISLIPYDNDSYILKLDTAGNFIWVKQLHGNGMYAMGAATDQSGNLYLSGSYDRVFNDFDPGVDTFSLSVLPGNYSQGFVAKFTAQGSLLWACASGEVARDITVDALGNVYSTGLLSDTADFDPGPGTFSLKKFGEQSGFLHKLDSAGNFISATRLLGDGVEVSLNSANRAYVFSMVARMIITKLGDNATSAPIVPSQTELQFTVFPNPAKNNITIDLGRMQQDIRVQVISASGQVVSTHYFKATQFPNVQLPKERGVYLLKVESEEGNGSLRVVSLNPE